VKQQPNGQEVPVTSTQPVAAPARVTVVTARACHFCTDALEALEELARQYPLAVEETAADGAAAQALLRRHGTGMFPLVLIDGEFFSAGRLPRRKLARLLAASGTAAAAGAGTR
jgi:glutaredoxin